MARHCGGGLLLDVYRIGPKLLEQRRRRRNYGGVFRYKHSTPSGYSVEFKAAINNPFRIFRTARYFDIQLRPSSLRQELNVYRIGSKPT